MYLFCQIPSISWHAPARNPIHGKMQVVHGPLQIRAHVQLEGSKVENVGTKNGMDIHQELLVNWKAMFGEERPSPMGLEHPTV
jgi:hypothetical protein